MTPQNLEALMLDRAAGALPPDVSQLLDAYLAQHPQAAGRSRRYHETIDLVRTALAPTADTVNPRIPPFPAAQVAAARGRKRRLAAIRPLAIAACLALAFFLGRGLTTPAIQPPTAPIIVAEATATGFWSLPAARSASSAARSLESDSVRWSSPLRWPQPGGSS